MRFCAGSLLVFPQSFVKMFIIKTHSTALFSLLLEFGTENESSSVAPTPSAETKSILMSLHGQPDRSIWRAERSLVGAKSEDQLCRGH